MNTGKRRRPFLFCKNSTEKCKPVLLLQKLIPAEAGWPRDSRQASTSDPVKHISSINDSATANRLICISTPRPCCWLLDGENHVQVPTSAAAASGIDHPGERAVRSHRPQA